MYDVVRADMSLKNYNTFQKLQKHRLCRSLYCFYLLSYQLHTPLRTFCVPTFAYLYMCCQGAAAYPENEDQQQRLREAAEGLRVATNAAAQNAIKKKLINRLGVSDRNAGIKRFSLQKNWKYFKNYAINSKANPKCDYVWRTKYYGRVQLEAPVDTSVWDRRCWMQISTARCSRVMQRATEILFESYLSRGCLCGSSCSPECCQAGCGRGHTDHRCRSECCCLQQEHCCSPAAGAQL